MSVFRSLARSRWDCKYPVVFIPKGRKKELYDKVDENLSCGRGILNESEKGFYINRITGRYCDHCFIAVDYYAGTQQSQGTGRNGSV